MKILTNSIKKQLIDNSNKHETTGETNFKPVVKLFGGYSCTWLLTELDEDGIAFGLCDLGHGEPELGYVSMDEIINLKFRPFGLGIERDRSFKADKTITEYAKEAKSHRRIMA